jgi:hypothetical protein
MFGGSKCFPSCLDDHLPPKGRREQNMLEQIGVSDRAVMMLAVSQIGIPILLALVFVNTIIVLARDCAVPTAPAP